MDKNMSETMTASASEPAVNVSSVTEVDQQHRVLFVQAQLHVIQDIDMQSNTCTAAFDLICWWHDPELLAVLQDGDEERLTEDRLSELVPQIMILNAVNPQEDPGLRTFSSDYALAEHGFVMMLLR